MRKNSLQVNPQRMSQDDDSYQQIDLLYDESFEILTFRKQEIWVTIIIYILTLS